MLSAALLAGVVMTARITPAADAVRMELEECRAALEKGQVVVIDVRNADGYRAGHIPGALLVPLDQVPAQAEKLKSLGKPIVAYCG